MPTPPPSPTPPYRLDDLGWLQFDRLCDLWLQAEAAPRPLHWRGHSDRWRVATGQDPLILPGPAVHLSGPVTVAALWIPASGPPGARRAELAGRLTALFNVPEHLIADQLLVITNLDSDQIGALLRAQAFTRHRDLTVIGPSELSAGIDRHPTIRAALPSVLGLRDLTELIAPRALARSSFDLTRARQLARVFWPTRAYDQARAVLAQHRFVVLTGPPEMGKTAIAQMLALAQLTDGWEAHDCTDPEQVFSAFARDRRQLFIADDAFGSTEYRADAAERWALGLGRMLPMLDQNHWLVWTSRPAPLKAGLRRVQRERHSERFPAPGEVLVDASDLEREEKTLILFRHAKSHGLSAPARPRLRAAGLLLVEHPHFTPERIRRFVTDRLGDLPEPPDLRRLIERELATPTDAMRNSFQALEPEHRDLLVALLDVPAGLIGERELTVAVRRHHPGGLRRPPTELIDRLTDHFLRVTPLGIGWVHPSWRDLVIEQLATDAPARQRFLSAAGIDGVTLALSQEGGAAGERQLPLLQDDPDWDRLGDRLHRLLPGLEAPELARLLFALDAAVLGTSDPRQQLECRSLATHLLDATRRMWARADRSLPAFLLDAWYRLRDRVPDVTQTPGLVTTWAELHPGAAALEHPDRAELIRADDWLALAQVLREHAVDELRALGFFTRDRPLLEGLITALFKLSLTDPESRPLTDSVLDRLQSLVPDLAEHARTAAAVAGVVENLDQARWWVPQDITAPPSTERVSAPTDFTPADIDRVLSDL